MNVRRPILIGVVLAIALSVALIVWRFSNPPGTATPTESNGTGSTEPAAAPSKPLVAQTPENDNGNVPIVFYGKLQDQAGQPVVEAEITGTAAAKGKFNTTSDANGLFVLKAGVGESLEVMPRKAGFALASTNNVETYTSLMDGGATDSNNPVVIKMWKLQGAEPLVNISKHYLFGYTGDPLFFDLATQEIVSSGGDLKITVVKPPDSASAADAQGWHVDMETDEAGGLTQISPEKSKITYWAPADGYQPKITLPMTGNSAQNSESLDEMFFVQAREGGIYAKLAVKISLNAQGLVNVDLHGIANTNGSCNWEGDPDTLASQ